MPFRNLRAWILIPGFIIFVAVLGLVHGSTTANSVPPSRAGISYHPTTAQQLAPPECSGMNLTSVAWQDNGTLQGTAGNELLIGTSNTVGINGRGGNDCLVIGSRNNNRLDGGPGYDVCIGNPTTRFDNCEVVIIRGAAPAGFTQMELTPTIETIPTAETLETNGSLGPAGLEESRESEAGGQVDPGREVAPETQPTIDPPAETEGDPVDEGVTETQ